MAIELPATTVIASRYRLFEEIGRGGFSVVHRAEHIHTGEQVALKFLNIGDRAGAGGRFEREARVSNVIRSEHIPRVLDAGFADEMDGRAYIAMELLLGADLEVLCALRGQLAPREVVDLIAQTACALDRAHKCGVIHRDLKPANLFLHTRNDGGVILKVLDFGIAKWSGAGHLAAVQTSGDMIVGTPVYMAPEQARIINQPLTHRVDIWALGLVAVKLLTGSIYWQETNFAAFLAALAADVLYPPSTRWPWLSAGFDSWFLRSCARNPDDRFDLAIEQATELALEQPIHALQLLLLTQLKAVFRELDPPLAMLTRWVVSALDRALVRVAPLPLEEELQTFAPAEPAY